MPIPCPLAPMPLINWNPDWLTAIATSLLALVTGGTIWVLIIHAKWFKKHADIFESHEEIFKRQADIQESISKTLAAQENIQTRQADMLEKQAVVQGTISAALFQLAEVSSQQSELIRSKAEEEAARSEIISHDHLPPATPADTLTRFAAERPYIVGMPALGVSRLPKWLLEQVGYEPTVKATFSIFTCSSKRGQQYLVKMMIERGIPYISDLKDFRRLDNPQFQIPLDQLNLKTQKPEIISRFKDKMVKAENGLERGKWSPFTVYILECDQSTVTMVNDPNYQRKDAGTVPRNAIWTWPVEKTTVELNGNQITLVFEGRK
jgi:hypothetical protein